MFFFSRAGLHILRPSCVQPMGLGQLAIVDILCTMHDAHTAAPYHVPAQEPPRAVRACCVSVWQPGRQGGRFTASSYQGASVDTLVRYRDDISSQLELLISCPGRRLLEAGSSSLGWGPPLPCPALPASRELSPLTGQTHPSHHTPFVRPNPHHTYLAFRFVSDETGQKQDCNLHGTGCPAPQERQQGAMPCPPCPCQGLAHA